MSSSVLQLGPPNLKTSDLRAIVAFKMHLRTPHRMRPKRRILRAIAPLDQKPRILRCFRHFGQCRDAE